MRSKVSLYSGLQSGQSESSKALVATKITKQPSVFAPIKNAQRMNLAALLLGQGNHHCTIQSTTEPGRVRNTPSLDVFVKKPGL